MSPAVEVFSFLLEIVSVRAESRTITSLILKSLRLPARSQAGAQADNVITLL